MTPKFVWVVVEGVSYTGYPPVLVKGFKLKASAEQFLKNEGFKHVKEGYTFWVKKPENEVQFEKWADIVKIPYQVD